MTNVDMYGANETYNMTEHEKLGVRTITLGISLPEYVDSNPEALNKKIYKKIVTPVKNLVSTGQGIEVDFGIPIANKRISVTSIAPVGSSACRHPEDLIAIAKTLDMAANEVGVNFIDGYSALASKGTTKADKNLVLPIPQALSQTERVCSSVNVGSIEIGISMDMVELMDRIATETAEATRGHSSLGYARLVVFCSALDDNPLTAGAPRGVIKPKTITNVGVSGPGIVKVVLAKVRDTGFGVLCETTKKATFKITRAGQLVAWEASRRMGIPFGIIDLSLVPTPSVRDSVTEILEGIGLERIGVPEITAALTMFNDRVKKGDVMTFSYVGGLSDTFIPVSEDQGMIDAVSMGALTIEKLEVTTYVYSAGLGMIAILGDTPSSTIAGTIADEATIGMVNQKTTAIRLIPVVGKKVGEAAEFDGLLGYASVMPVNIFSCRRFVARGGKVPAPVHGFKN